MPDPTLEARVRLFWVALAKDYEAVFYQYQAGQLPQTIWEGWLTEITMILDTPGGRDALVGMKGTILSDSFVKFIQTQLRSPDTPRLLDVRAAWSAAAEARREQSER